MVGHAQNPYRGDQLGRDGRVLARGRYGDHEVAGLARGAVRFEHGGKRRDDGRLALELGDVVRARVGPARTSVPVGRGPVTGTCS